MSFVASDKTPSELMDPDGSGGFFTSRPGLLVTRDHGLVTLTLNRPDSKNAIDGPLWDSLKDMLNEIAETPDDRAVLLTGAGGNFSSGADLSGGLSAEPQEARPVIEGCLLYTSPSPRD